MNEQISVSLPASVSPYITKRLARSLSEYFIFCFKCVYVIYLFMVSAEQKQPCDVLPLILFYRKNLAAMRSQATQKAKLDLSCSQVSLKLGEREEWERKAQLSYESKACAMFAQRPDSVMSRSFSATSPLRRLFLPRGQSYCCLHPGSKSTFSIIQNVSSRACSCHEAVLNGALSWTKHQLLSVLATCPLTQPVTVTSSRWHAIICAAEPWAVISVSTRVSVLCTHGRAWGGW